MVKHLFLFLFSYDTQRVLDGYHFTLCYMTYIYMRIFFLVLL
jgi:hypothetical protein